MFKYLDDACSICTEVRLLVHLEYAINILSLFKFYLKFCFIRSTARYNTNAVASFVSLINYTHEYTMVHLHKLYYVGHLGFRCQSI